MRQILLDPDIEDRIRDNLSYEHAKISRVSLPNQKLHNSLRAALSSSTYYPRVRLQEIMYHRARLEGAIRYLEVWGWKS
jgi:hypothetical protein